MGTGRRSLILGLLAQPAAAAPRRRRAEAPAKPSTAAATPPARAPDIDAPPRPSAIPGLEPAPVPLTNPRRPAGDGAARSSLDLGVPVPSDPYQGQSFTTRDPSPDRRTPQGSIGLPNPGATIRVPF